MTSRDGYQWTEQNGLQKGVPTIGLIEPSEMIRDSSQIFDAIIVGGGYTALTAARDLTISGLNVLLLEARDRIGGRSWSSNIDGYPFEMGGTWVHWGQAHVWREISRYDMRKELEISQDYSFGVNNFTLFNVPGEKTNISHHLEDLITESALKKFVNVDGNFGKRVMPFPHDAEHNPEVIQYDHLTAADRLAQISHELTTEESTCLKSFILLCSSATLETMSFFEFLHWWALSGYSYEGCVDYLMRFKFRNGQSSFAIKFWQEAISTGRLSYSFICPLTKITDGGENVTVTSENGTQFKALRCVSTVPLNVLKTIAFEPALPSAKTEAFNIGHLNQCVKVHAEVRNKELRSWSGVNPFSELSYAFGDGTTPAGNTHIVAFGADEEHLDYPEKDIPRTSALLKNLTDMDIKRIVFHNWSDDKYAKGAWFFPGKDFVTKYLGALRARYGNIFFANSDWAVGWRSFIDGAIEEGSRAALDVKKDLQELGKTRKV